MAARLASMTSAAGSSGYMLSRLSALMCAWVTSLRRSRCDISFPTEVLPEPARPEITMSWTSMLALLLLVVVVDAGVDVDGGRW